MDFDFKKPFELIKGGLFSHEATWNEYLAGNPGWQQTAAVLTGPLILLNVVLGVLFSRMTGGYAAYGFYGNVVSALLIGLIVAVIGFLIAVFVFNFLAGVFQGKPDFSRAFAAVSLAAIPSWIAGIIGALVPGVGFLIALAGGIVTLFFLYKIMPLALGIPSGKRLVHFIASVVAIFVVNLVIGMIVAPAALREGPRVSDTPGATSSTPVAGVLGEWGRQAELMEAAGQDAYDPPADGRISKQQMEAYAGVLRKTSAAHERYEQKMAALSADIEAKEKSGKTPSVADLSKLYAGVNTALGANNAEMEIVKTAGGNWAEHQWVKNQLRTAQLQQGEGSEAIEHNYELYRQYAEEIGDSL